MHSYFTIVKSRYRHAYCPQLALLVSMTILIGNSIYIFLTFPYGLNLCTTDAKKKLTTFALLRSYRWNFRWFTQIGPFDLCHFPFQYFLLSSKILCLLFTCSGIVNIIIIVIMFGHRLQLINYQKSIFNIFFFNFRPFLAWIVASWTGIFIIIVLVDNRY